MARLSLNLPPAMEPDVRQRRIADLEAAKERLEGAVGEHSAEFRAQVPTVTLREPQRARHRRRSAVRRTAVGRHRVRAPPSAAAKSATGKASTACRALVLGGAETLAMSLWPVTDYVTREMMTAYCSNLQTGHGRGDAQRQARLAMLKRQGRQHPFDWASFIQSGEWANLDGQCPRP